MKARNPLNCAPLSVSRDCIAHITERGRLATCLPPSTPGSPRASLQAISSRQRTCSINSIRKIAHPFGEQAKAGIGRSKARRRQNHFREKLPQLVSRQFALLRLRGFQFWVIAGTEE